MYYKSLIISILSLLGCGIVFLLEQEFKWGIISVYGSLYCLFFFYVLKIQTGSYFSPAGVFVCFYWLLLLGRPFLTSIGMLDLDKLVEASKYDEAMGIRVNYYLVLTIISIGIGYFLLGSVKLKLFDFFEHEQVAPPSKVVLLGIFVFFVLFGIKMLKDGFTASAAIKDVGYIDLVESGGVEYFSQIAYTIVKWSWFFLFFFIYDNKKATLITLIFLIFLVALPLSGLRGYFITYILMAITLLEGRKIIRLKLVYILPFIVILLSSVTFMLEYRLGFTLSEGTWMSPLIIAIATQGATYEVVYGAVAYVDHLNFFKNVVFNNFFGYPTFGNYVDQLRGVSFGDNLGFATSAIAEILSASYIGWFLYIILLAIVLNILNKAFINIKKSNFNYFIIFFMAPIVWAQPRGALLQMVGKFILFLLIMSVINYLQNKRLRFN